METYGVSFDGFQPSCGWPMYKHVKEELIPQLEREVERWRARRDAAEGERIALKGLKADIDGLVKSRAGLVDKLQAPIAGGGAKVDDVMPLGVKEAEVETDGTWSELSSWLTDAANPLGQISFFYKHACARVPHILWEVPPPITPDLSLGLCSPSIVHAVSLGPCHLWASL